MFNFENVLFISLHGCPTSMSCIEESCVLVVFIMHLSRFTYIGIILFTGKGKVRSQKTSNRLDSTMYINVADDSDTELLKIEQLKSSQVSVE